MIIQQLSVFLENKEGRLVAATDVLSQNNINISALSLADTTEFGVLRLIVDKPELAKKVLMESGVVVSITQVNAIVMDDKPGGTVEILRKLSSAHINIEYMYACVGNTIDKALMIVRTSDTLKAEEVLMKEGFSEQNPSNVYRI